jgi:GntR family transcriptional regulator of arabinose operon
VKKYETVKAWIKSNIDSGLIVPGEKLPSETELMARFGVSRNAVRQAINELGSEKLVESKHGIGTFCLRRIQGKTMMIGLVCFRSSSYIFPKIIHGCNKVVQKNGYHLVLNESWYDINNERNILLALSSNKVDGIIITPIQSDTDKNNGELLRKIEESGIPVVLLDNRYPDHSFTNVVLDDYQAGIEAARYLWNCGHRSIGILYSFNYRPKLQRKEGALRFLAEQRTPGSEENIIGIEGQSSAKKTYGQIRDIFRKRTDYPTAFICSGDDEALMFMYVAQKHGIRVPEDISIVSFDNSEMARYSHPRLTSMNHPSEYMGELAATLLLNKIYHPEIVFNSQTVISSQLVKRDSVRILSS